MPGTLHLSPEEFSLRLRGSLRPPAPLLPEGKQFHTSLWEWAEVPTVLGLAEDDTLVTLVDSVGHRITAPLVETTAESWSPESALLGAHLPETDDRIFSRAQVVVEHLAAWAGAPRLTTRSTGIQRASSWRR